MAASNDTWLATNTFGAVGQDNFAALPANSVFSIAAVQHEPGPQCTTLIDCPFTGPNGNLEACQRYYQKSYGYAVLPGTASIGPGLLINMNFAGTSPNFPIPFKRTMAKAPTVSGYSYAGIVNTVRDATAGLDKTISSSTSVGDIGFSGFSISSPNAAQWMSQFHYTADAGW
jgi:hypothetical protein